ncbi:MAG: mechanosensitive ion channel family protein [Phycisphaerales bacterium]|nr:mechanosensitive ion channel family protein [Phycisphaerales bacterium]
MAWQDQPAADIAAPASAGPTPLIGALDTDAAGSAAIDLLSGRGDTADWLTLWQSLGWPITKALVLIFVVLIVSGWAGRFVTGVSRKARVEETLARFFGNLAKYAIMVLGGLAILSTFGINTASFAAVIAAAGFALGMALSGTLGNFASGVMLLIFRPFKVGDVVNAGGVTGQVDEIGMFSTVFDTPDNRRIIVPNGSIYGATIENITYHKHRRVDVAVGTDYGADLDMTREVLMGVATGVLGRLPHKEPVVYLNELGASSVDWAVRVWAPTADYWTVRERLTRDIKVALDTAGISIPFPHRTVQIPAGIDVRIRKD